jgi:hypothetical protein
VEAKGPELAFPEEVMQWKEIQRAMLEGNNSL